MYYDIPIKDIKKRTGNMKDSIKSEHKLFSETKDKVNDKNKDKDNEINPSESRDIYKYIE